MTIYYRHGNNTDNNRYEKYFLKCIENYLIALIYRT